jgi:hypothetical protein
LIFHCFLLLQVDQEACRIRLYAQTSFFLYYLLHYGGNFKKSKFATFETLHQGFGFQVKISPVGTGVQGYQGHKGKTAGKE